MRTDVASPQAWCEGLWQTRGEGRRSFLKGMGQREGKGGICGAISILLSRVRCGCLRELGSVPLRFLAAFCE